MGSYRETSQPQRWSIASSHARAEILSTGGMLNDAAFRLGDGRWIKPFATAPWAGNSEMADLPGHMRWLGGEFACLPFGCGGPVRGVTPAWRATLDGSVTQPNHGAAANKEWSPVGRTAEAVELRIDYPPEDSIAYLIRRVEAARDAAAFNLSLEIHARKKDRVPVGLHPIVSLDRPVGDVRLSADFAAGFCYPAIVEPDRMLTEPGGRFSSLASVPGRAGGRIDFSRLPVAEPTEDVVQICNVRGPITVDLVDDRARLIVDWDRKILPHASIWVGDRALQSRPWGGRFRGLGIEPIASCFDFSDQVSRHDNPLNREGFSTTVAVSPEAPVILRYRLEMTPI
jgi:hypothetical protein